MGKAMTKGALVKALADEHEMKPKVCSGVIDSLVTIATSEVKKSGIFTIPGLCRIKTRVKPATKAGVRNIFGKETKVAAKPAKNRQGLPSGSFEGADLSDSLASERFSTSRGWADVGLHGACLED